MPRSDGFEGGLKLGERFEVVDLRGRNQRSDAAPSATAFIMTCKKRILPRQCDWTDQVFGSIGVDLDTAVVEEGLQPVLLAMDVGQLLPETRL